MLLTIFALIRGLLLTAIVCGGGGFSEVETVFLNMAPLDHSPAGSQKRPNTTDFVLKDCWAAQESTRASQNREMSRARGVQGLYHR